MEKNCKHCKQRLTVSQFYRDSARKDGYKNICKKCDNKKRTRINRQKKQIQKQKYKENFINRTHLNSLLRKLTNFENMSIEQLAPLTKEINELTQVLTIDKKRYFIVSRFNEEVEGLINAELSMTYRMPILPPHLETRNVNNKIVLVLPENQIIPENIKEAITRKLNL